LAKVFAWPSFGNQFGTAGIGLQLGFLLQQTKFSEKVPKNKFFHPSIPKGMPLQQSDPVRM